MATIQPRTKMPIVSKAPLQYKTWSHMGPSCNITTMGGKQNVTYSELELLSIHFCLEETWVRSFGKTLSGEFQCLAGLVTTLFRMEAQNIIRGLPLLFNVHIFPKFHPASLNVEQILNSTKLQVRYKFRYHTRSCVWRLMKYKYK